VYYIHVDALGSPVAETNAQGQVVRQVDYRPYGAELGGAVDGPAFTGHYRDAATGLVEASLYMTLLGLGMGMVLQVVVLAVQNDLDFADLGAGTSTVPFFRSLGGAAGVSVLGAILASRVTGLVTDGLAALGVDPAATQSGGSTSLDLGSLPEPVRVVVEHAYGDGTALAFLVSGAVAVVAFDAVLFLKEKELRTTVGTPAPAANGAGDGDARVTGTPG
jgi:hypothetical protein